MSAVTKATHPKCGQTFPGGDSAGHCSACCETFIGKASFDAHRVGAHTPATRRCEVQPYEKISDEGKTTYGHWRDERGFWRYGKKLTKAESAEIFKNRDAA